ncbi:biopolymer transport protein ExbD [Chitinophaga dinghuensis]|uniref:Biopolymer transport protein ExbD n=1 Tax=Chitinophaga dinghuensis TaxID=1539050 RepID=A0A327W5E5_9BACT|nr:biopolymer transporter ExbD [Chitinophaga dinghuensis]RAJ85717.1 biopolymer transport protein ExbD [Chitinophaga dinghuensis]
MAEINTNTNGSNRHGKKRAVKKSTRVDMTPMVDLGFLLITFFMLTTTLSQPKTLNLIMPADDGKTRTALAESKALTVILGPDNKVAWYEGMGNDPQSPPELHYTNFANTNGIRDVIIRKKEKVEDQFHQSDLTVLIKADKSSNYKNLVDIMDEMLINRVDRYAVVDITQEESRYFH